MADLSDIIKVTNAQTASRCDQSDQRRMGRS